MIFYGYIVFIRLLLLTLLHFFFFFCGIAHAVIISIVVIFCVLFMSISLSLFLSLCVWVSTDADDEYWIWLLSAYAMDASFSLSDLLNWLRIGWETNKYSYEISPRGTNKPPKRFDRCVVVFRPLSLSRTLHHYLCIKYYLCFSLCSYIYCYYRCFFQPNIGSTALVARFCSCYSSRFTCIKHY